MKSQLLDLAPLQEPTYETPAPRKAGKGEQGKNAEAQVQAYLKAWSTRTAGREFNRLMDSRAAQRIVKSAPADFDFYCRMGNGRYFGLIEVKETKHAFRLSHQALTQYPAMLHREAAGGLCFVLVHHSTTGIWRSVSIAWLQSSYEGGSWDLSEVGDYLAPRAALRSICDVFD